VVDVPVGVAVVGEDVTVVAGPWPVVPVVLDPPPGTPGPVPGALVVEVDDEEVLPPVFVVVVVVVLTVQAPDTGKVR
jgi:hypothetical protein